MKHDIIFIERTHRWVCKCGKSGFLKSEMLKHEQEIEAEALPNDASDVHNERVHNLINDVCI